MKNLIILSFFILFSCSTRKKDNNNHITQDITAQLSQDELSVVNNFLETELATDRYKNYRSLEIVVIEESLKKSQSIEAYEYAYSEFLQMEKIDKRGDTENRFFIDNLKIIKLKEILNNEYNYYWKITDFKNYKVSIMKNETLRNIINSGEYIKLPEKLILYISTPLMINENNALISFDIGSSRSGFGSLNHYTALMRKINEKWVHSAYYYDGVMY